jgi:hypothetical protein
MFDALGSLGIKVLWRSPRYLAVEELVTRSIVTCQRGQASNEGVGPGISRIYVPLLGKAKVNEDGSIGGREHDIGRLDIVVGCLLAKVSQSIHLSGVLAQLTNSIFVQICQCACQLLEVAFSTLFGDADRHELRQKGHDNPEQTPKAISIPFRIPRTPEIEHIQGITRSDDKRIKPNNVGMRISFQASNNLHLAPQGSNSSSGSGLLGPMNELNGDFGGMMLRGNSM